MIEDPITTQEAMSMLGLSQPRLSVLCSTGKLNAVKFSGVWIISKKSVEDRIRKEIKAGRPRKES